jgi:hypothetical protein
MERKDVRLSVDSWVCNLRRRRCVDLTAVGRGNQESDRSQKGGLLSIQRYTEETVQNNLITLVVVQLSKMLFPICTGSGCVNEWIE